ncbi:hypothetical protein MNF30_00980 [Mycoplasma mycoides subsp. capri]|nr:hypothetical protein [Mycoplasma mycoides]UZK64385.1 hypothetical protein MNF30_00980 [Mycoplasma mycoides subsp. capri]
MFVYDGEKYGKILAMIFFIIFAIAGIGIMAERFTKKKKRYKYSQMIKRT